MYCDYFIFFFKIKCPGKIPNIQGIWEICPGNHWFQVGNSAFSPCAERLSHCPDQDSFHSFERDVWELLLHLSEGDDRVGERCVYKVTVADRPGNGGGTEVDLTFFF